VGSERSRRVDVRVVAATHRDLKRAVSQGEFRDDLYFRLRVVELQLPPLRERGDDILELAQFMLDKACRQLNKPAMQLDPGALKLIRQHNWPGNVRELENAMERAVILSEAGSISAEQLGLEPLLKAGSGNGADLSLEDYFRQFVLEHQDHMTETELARRLGISRKALWERRQRFALPRARKGSR
jgi:DNA-binding NtrC family response regulator